MELIDLKSHKRLLDAGVEKLSYVEGENLLFGDDATDGSHPSDLWFYRHAEAFEPMLKAALAT